MLKNLTPFTKEALWRNYTGETVRSFREGLGISQAELGIALGVSRVTIVGLEKRGSSAEISVIWKIALREIFRHPLDYLGTTDGRNLTFKGAMAGQDHD